jgi:valyl-tRNA synthetase
LVASAAASADDKEKWSYARQILGEVRKRRSEAKQPLKVPIARAVISDDGSRLSSLDALEDDLRAAVRIERVERKPRPGDLSVEVEFGSTESA